ncbi:serine hydrolase domain-containing protein [Streptomyces mirabilis]|uniref:serine hydrolase domain-containing protein n=1 Tax=Streptomyces mirabilis TaxID=68239 RepID=UPI0036EBEEBB
MAGAARKLFVPGAVVLLRTPQGTFEAKVGATDLSGHAPPDAGTHFRIASTTRTMTSALIMLLAQDGRLHLGDPVSAYVPDVPGGKHITIADLLKMRSGLHDCTSAREPAATLDADPAKAWTPHEVLAMAFRHPPEFPPDASFEYCTTNYALPGLVAEKAGGRPLAQQFQDRLFGPLGLRRTSLPAADDSSLPDRFSHGYIARTTTSRSSSGRPRPCHRTAGPRRTPCSPPFSTRSTRDCRCLPHRPPAPRGDLTWTRLLKSINLDYG